MSSKKASARRLAAANERLRRRNAELSAANAKLAGALMSSEARRHDFEANLSHELMTPITAIKGYSESLAGGSLKIPGRGLKFARIIEGNAVRLALVVEDILHLSSFESGAKVRESKAVDLLAQVRAQLAGVRGAADRRGITMSVAIPRNMKVLFKKQDLSRVLLLLLANAIKYNRPNGRVEIRARRAGRRAVVTIRDSGIGVPAGDLPHIFDRFHRAENARAMTERGSGLGLSLVRSILLAGGCRIWAESAEGEGTAMFFTLPLVAPANRGGAVPRSVSGAGGARRAWSGRRTRPRRGSR